MDFSKVEFDFFIDFKIDKILREIIELCKPDILYYKKQIKKATGQN